MAYQRQPPPPVTQWVMGFWIYGFAAPLVRLFGEVGLVDRALRKIGARRERELAANNPFRGYTPGAQDVFVMTYAKSGTNWMMQIAHQLIYHGHGDFDHIHDVVPWPDTQAMSRFMKKYAIPLAEASHWKVSPERMRVIKTHFNWDMLPHSNEARYIAVIRDPKDIFVSSYFFIKDGVFGPAMPSVDVWFRSYLSDTFLLGGSWAVNAAGYWAERHRLNMLVVPFKSMTRDLRSTVVKVADFLNIRAPDAVIDEVCRRSSFEYMKQIDHKFHIGKLMPWRPPGAMMRKGTQGGSSELLSRERQRKVDAHFMAELKQLGSDFPYQEFCDVAP